MAPNRRWQSWVRGVISLKAWNIASAALTVTALIGVNGVTSPLQAAQSVVLRRGTLRQSIALAELKTLAQTGQVPPSLDPYARSLTQEQRRQIIAALQANFNIKPGAVRSFLNTPIGNDLALALASVTPRRDRVGVQSMKTALVVGAKANSGLSALEVIEAYPSPSIEIDLDRAFEVIGNFNVAFWRTQAFMAAIAPQLAPKDPQINLPFDPTQRGSAEVEVLSLNLKDWKRRRAIPVDVYSSKAASANKPLIIFSHGLGSVKIELRYLAEHLASHGYVVAALEHPGSNEAHIRKALKLDTSSLGVIELLNSLREALLRQTPILDAEEFLNRPKDISFVLDELAKLNQTTEPLQGKLSLDRVLVIGYSLGGSTALSLAGAEIQLTQLKQRCPGNVLAFSLGENAQCFAKSLPEDRYQLRDPRIKAAISLSPTTSLLFGETGLTQVTVPTLIAAGSADKTTPALTEQAIPFNQMPSPKWLVGFVGGTHLSVKDPSTTMDQAGQPNTLYTGGEVVGEQAVEVRNYVKAIALAMAAQLTDEADRYRIFLTPDYAQFASTERFPIRLVTTIPPEAEAILK
ncbi:MAG TPA: dienelactone hydrolase [Cyanobacteria bacterium UBA8803]|nr:dienelactone hydrolase [Cyanobacteria bacterium UBA9273]HBL61767.1 dienelactone hydrolase [Cyanobacteria bacterium UBA8803]